MHYYLQSLMHHPFLVTTIYNALLPQGQVKKAQEITAHRSRMPTPLFERTFHITFDCSVIVIVLPTMHWNYDTLFTPRKYNPPVPEHT
jgi:hypothetical protein